MKVTKVMLDDLYEEMKKTAKIKDRVKTFEVLLDVKTNKLGLEWSAINHKNTIEAISEEKTEYLLKEIAIAINTRSLGKYKEVFYGKVGPLLTEVDETYTPEFERVFKDIILYAEELPKITKALEPIVLSNKPFGKLTEEEERFANFFINITNPYMFINPKTGMFSIDEDNGCYEAAESGKLLKQVMKLSHKKFLSSNALVLGVMREKPTNMEEVIKFVKKFKKEENNTSDLFEYGCCLIVSLKEMHEICVRIESSCRSLKKITDAYQKKMLELQVAK